MQRFLTRLFSRSNVCSMEGKREMWAGKGPDERRVLEEEKKKKREEKAVKRPQENRKGQRDR